MSDKRPHIKPTELAGLIRQYLAGELDDKAMHDLERQALDDPFLADALDGYAQHRPEQQTQQADLTFRLAARVAPQQGKVRTMYYRWAAAAAILLLLFSGGWFLWNEQKRTLPIAGITPLQPAPVTDSAVPVVKEAAPALAAADNLSKKVAPPVATVPAISREAAKEPRRMLKSADATAPTPSTETALKKEKELSAPMNDASAGLHITKVSPLAAAGPTKAKSAAPPILADKSTDDSSKSSGLNEVVVSGYSVQKNVRIRGVAAVKADSLHSNALNEMVVVKGKVAGVDSGNADAEAVYSAPTPATGFTSFQNYLTTHTTNPDNQSTGTVRVSFTVMPDGSLQDFKVTRHLNEACDAEAIRVIKEGPEWRPASDGKPAKVKLKVRFTVKKD
ncbi:TonB family protein [Chitinophaga niastensis]|uniref:TonB family protein n=1 Tax=Chitinophaga niastensis TaxID=536980 RepID=A0A2P8HSC0_CHINA|nr:TonB family protein [Chitinophaga niastensis]PSL49095.1 TonB family protein [Chitinophaga niastensis]